jgi:hypothetical protein
MNERLPLASVALIAGAALANEILLTRFFAVIHWYHFAYMMISLALLGFGASGTLLALARRWLVDRYAPAFIANLVMFGLCALIAPLVAQKIPFRAEELLWNPWQPLWLVAVYLVLSVPFFCAANAIGLALIAYQRCAGRIYAADLMGAGVGSLLILVALYLVAPEGRTQAAGGGWVRCGTRGIGRTSMAQSSLACGECRRCDGCPGRSLCVVAPRARNLQEPEPGASSERHAGHRRTIESARARERHRESTRAAAPCAGSESGRDQRAAAATRALHRWRQHGCHHGRP